MIKYSQNIIFILTCFLLSCSGSTTNNNGNIPNPNSNLANLEIRLTDAPADYESVMIDIRDIQINMTTDENSGWQTPENVKVGIYDLLKFANGKDTLLATAKFPIGTIKQIRLILGENNLVGENGKLYPLSTPSGQNSGIKINTDVTLVANATYQLVLDFDASRSIIKAGNSGKYLLKPVIRGFLATETGQIRGEISPSNIKTVVWAISGTDSVGTYTDNKGKFLVRGLREGNYKLVILPKKPYKEKTIDNIMVLKDKITNLLLIKL